MNDGLGDGVAHKGLILLLFPAQAALVVVDKTRLDAF